MRLRPPRARGWIRGLLFGRDTARRARDEIDDEIEAHLDETMARLMEEGFDEDAAHAEALRRFGDVARWRHHLVRIEKRRVRRRGMWEWIEGIRSGLVFAVRSVSRAPGFAVAVIVTLALGIGANATIFGVVDRLLVRAPDHVMQPEQVRRLLVRQRSGGVSGPGSIAVAPAMTYPDIDDLRDVPAFAAVGGWAPFDDMTLGDGPSARRIAVRGASAGFFEVLRARPHLGRFIGRDDDRRDAPPTVVLGWEFWNRSYGANPSVLGRTLHIGDGRYEVVGVAPRGFTGADLAPVDAWLALQPAAMEVWGDNWIDNRRWWAFRAVARMAPEVDDAVAREQATAAYRAGRADDESSDREAEIVPAPIVIGQAPDAPTEAGVTRWLAGVSLAVLLIACLNVANLFLGRAVRLRRELAVRLAIGSSRIRLTAHFLTETLILALVAAAVAAVVAVVGGRVLLSSLLPEVSFGSLTGPPRVVVFTFAVSIGAALISGVIPALRAGRTDLRSGLSEGGGRGATHASSRLRATLVAAQAALTTVLLVGAGLFVRSLDAARSTDLGFDPDRVAAIRFEGGEELEVRGSEVYRRIEEALPRLPAVEAAARSTSIPFRGGVRLQIFAPGRDTMLLNADGSWPTVTGAGPDYFRTLGLSVEEGRGIVAADLSDEAELVAVVNRRLAETLWPGESALDRCLRIDGSGAECSRIVGVVSDHVSAQIDEVPKMRVVTPIGRGPMQGVYTVLVRTQGDPAGHYAALRDEVTSVAPGLRFVEIQPLDELVGERFRSWRLGASLFGLFGVLAVLVAGVGVYGVLAFEVALRRHELGIRMALGAPQGRVVRGVIFAGLRIVGVGAIVGLGAAALVAPRIEGLLFGVEGRDLASFGVTVLVLGLSALAASGLPAWRATRVDPTQAMRSE